MELDVTASHDAISAPADFDTCYRELFPRVARTAALVARDPQLGPDLAQEAFARLYERWDRMASPEHARNFAFRVALNLARSHLRRWEPDGVALRPVARPRRRLDADEAHR